MCFLVSLSDFPRALLLLVLTCPQVSRSVPVRTDAALPESCVSYAQTLLHNITDTLIQNKLFSGIDCTAQSVELNTDTDTPSACAPKESTCSGKVKSTFDQESCLFNIGEDLRHYYKFLVAQPEADSRLLLSGLTEIMKNCFPRSLTAELASREAAAERPSSYDERLSLCKVLKGFQVRSITMSRAIAYMSAGDHRR
ncbi:interleukin-12 subunit alpha [Clinocottus analis]|uniref:interleukin-12 subunit alpha n=1 Tax=Clinocottus analis TaxID=304258 RepID=UPI0035C2068F